MADLVVQCVFALYFRVRMDSWWPYFKGYSSFIYGSKSQKCCLVASDMCDYHDYQSLSQIFYILFSLGIHRGTVKLGPTVDNFEVQMVVPFE